MSARLLPLLLYSILIFSSEVKRSEFARVANRIAFPLLFYEPVQIEAITRREGLVMADLAQIAFFAAAINIPAFHTGAAFPAYQIMRVVTHKASSGLVVELGCYSWANSNSTEPCS